MKTKYTFSFLILMIVFIGKAQTSQKNYFYFDTANNTSSGRVAKNVDAQYVEISFEDEQEKTHQFSDFLFFSKQKKLKQFPLFRKAKNYYYLQITDEKFNGYIYLYDIFSEKFKKQVLYENEPTWTRSFFGKTQNGNPILYHIDEETNFIYQSYLKNGQWKIHRTFPLTDKQLEELFAEQSIESSSDKQNVFDLDMDIEDSYFQFLEWKAELEGNPKYYKEGAIYYPKNDEDGPFYIPECWKTQKTTESDVIEIQNMPPVKTQNTMGECRAFSLAVLIQKFICENSKNADGSKRYIDCSNPPPDKAISYFGMMVYTNSI